MISVPITIRLNFQPVAELSHPFAHSSETYSRMQTLPRLRLRSVPFPAIFHLNWIDLRILIVDDSEPTRRILATMVRSRHWTVCGEAENGLSELKPDLVLLDLAMPDISGIEAARWMSASDPTVPLILFTVVEWEGLETTARDAGICAVVSKAEGLEPLESSKKRSRNPTNQISKLFRPSACEWRSVGIVERSVQGS
jgi:CheY-like chemotaxis protein